MIDQNDVPDCFSHRSYTKRTTFACNTVGHGNLGETEHPAIRHPGLPDVLDGVVVHPHILMLLLEREVNLGAELADLVRVKGKGDDQRRALCIEWLAGIRQPFGHVPLPLSIISAHLLPRFPPG